MTQKGVERIGETITNTKGYRMTIIEYKNSDKILVRFEDGSTKITRYRTFKAGNVRKPEYAFKCGNVKKPNYNLRQKRLGETSMSIRGQLMTIIEYIDTYNVTVQFEDGATNIATYASFRRGLVKNPNLERISKRDDRIGEIAFSTKGQRMEIIEYTNIRNIKVKFEDGTIKSTHYQSFKNGHVKNPNYQP